MFFFFFVVVVLPALCRVVEGFMTMNALVGSSVTWLVGFVATAGQTISRACLDGWFAAMEVHVTSNKMEGSKRINRSVMGVATWRLGAWWLVVWQQVTPWVFPLLLFAHVLFGSFHVVPNL
jgi:hypothetical protein